MGIHIDTCRGVSHQICSFMRADNYWMDSVTLRNALATDDEVFDPNLKPRQLVVDEHPCR